MATSGSHVLLHSLGIRHYRSIKRAEFEAQPTLSVLIGPNGSGKTNVLNAVQLLRPERTPYRQTAPALRSSRCDISATFSIKRKLLYYRAQMVLGPSERNQDQVVAAKKEWNLKDFGGKDTWLALPHALMDPRYRDYYIVGSSEAGIFQHRRWRGAPELPRSAAQAIDSAIQFVSSINYYSASQFTNPSRSPSSFEIEEGDRVLETYADRGPHLSFVSGLYRVYKRNRKLYQSYLGLVGTRGLGLIDDIEWKPVVLSTSSVDVRTGGRVVRRRKKRVLIVPVVSFRRTRLSFNQLSEGTFRTLALVFYLLTDESQLLLIEEPEVCVHHGLMRSLIEIIKAYSGRKQIIISSHSELVLDLVAPENVYLVSNRAVRGTTVQPLSKAMSSKALAAMKEYLATSGNLGEYWTHGGFE